MLYYNEFFGGFLTEDDLRKVAEDQNDHLSISLIDLFTVEFKDDQEALDFLHEILPGDSEGIAENSARHIGLI